MTHLVNYIVLICKLFFLYALYAILFYEYAYYSGSVRKFGNRIVNYYSVKKVSDSPPPFFSLSIFLRKAGGFQ